MVYCLNKIDAISIEELDLLYRIPNAVPISSEHGWNIDELMELMWDKLALKRVYTKPKGKAPDYSSPVVLRSNRSTVEDFVSNHMKGFPGHCVRAAFPNSLSSVTLSTRPLWSNLRRPSSTANRSSTSHKESGYRMSWQMRMSVSQPRALHEHPRQMRLGPSHPPSL